MGRIIAGIAAGGWAAIVWIAYRLADARIAVCHMADTYTAEASCTVRAMAVRDNLLTIGLAVGLLGLIALLATFATRRARQPQGKGFSSRSTSQGPRPLPRS